MHSYPLHLWGANSIAKCRNFFDLGLFKKKIEFSPFSRLIVDLWCHKDSDWSSRNTILCLHVGSMSISDMKTHLSWWISRLCQWSFGKIRITSPDVWFRTLMDSLVQSCSRHSLSEGYSMVDVRSFLTLIGMVSLLRIWKAILFDFWILGDDKNEFEISKSPRKWKRHRRVGPKSFLNCFIVVLMFEGILW